MPAAPCSWSAKNSTSCSRSAIAWWSLRRAGCRQALPPRKPRSSRSGIGCRACGTSPHAPQSRRANMLKLEVRPAPSRLMSVASPVLALAMTVVIGVLLFMLLGKDPMRGLYVFFIEPLSSWYALSELAMKATPLLLIALGLAVCFRANVWNIGAEGQFIIGAIAASGIAMQAGPQTGRWVVVAILVAGVAGGMVWAAIVAFLRDRANANGILVSLLLVYVCEMG